MVTCPYVPLHAAGLELAGRVQGVVAGQLGPVEGVGVAVQPVQDDPGGGVAADAELVVVVVVAAEDPHAVGREEAGPAVVQGRDVADHPAAGVRLRLDGRPLPAAGVVPDGDRVQGHAAGAAGERRLQAPPAVQHRARLPAEGVARPGLDAEVAQVGAGLDQVGGAGGVRVHHLLGDVADADGHRRPARAPGRRRRADSTVRVVTASRRGRSQRNDVVYADQDDRATALFLPPQVKPYGPVGCTPNRCARTVVPPAFLIGQRETLPRPERTANGRGVGAARRDSA